MRKIISIFLVLLVFLSMTNCASSLPEPPQEPNDEKIPIGETAVKIFPSYEQVSKIEIGMTLQEVKALISRPHADVRSSKFPLTYEWNMDDGRILQLTFYRDGYEELWESLRNDQYVPETENVEGIFMTDNEFKVMMEWYSQTKVIEIQIIDK